MGRYFDKILGRFKDEKTSGKSKELGFYLILNTNDFIIVDLFGTLPTEICGNLAPNSNIKKLFKQERDFFLFKKQLSKAIEEKKVKSFTIEVCNKRIEITVHPGELDVTKVIVKFDFLNYRNEHIGVDETPDDIDFKNIFEKAPDGVLICNSKEQIIGLNRKYTIMTGFGYDEVYGKFIKTVLEKDPRATDDVRLSDLDRKESGVIVNRKLKKKAGGELVDVEISARKGGVDKYIIVIRDISDRKIMRKKLEISEKNLEGLFRNSPFGIVRCSPEGKVLDINDAFIKLLGSPSKDTSVKINLMKFPQLIEIGFSKILQSVFEKKQRVVHQFKYKTMWEKTVYVKCYFVPVFLDGVNIDSVYVITEDNTKEQFFLKEVQQTKAKAVKSNDIKTKFLRNVAYKIKNPLEAILGFVELIDCSQYSKEEITQFKEEVVKEGQKLFSIINNIIEISRVDADEVSIKKERIFVKPFINSLIVEAEKKIKKSDKKIKINYSYQSRTSTIESDFDMMTRIFKYLLNNSVKHTVEGQIDVNVYDYNNNIVLQVKDTGVGMTKLQLEQISQGLEESLENVETRLREGMSLGLSLTKKVVEKLGGEFEVTSFIGEGSAFKVMFPVD